jgi:hypothetical protein
VSPFYLLEVFVLGRLSLGNRGLSYLRPSFSSHPLNYFLVFLIFLGAFSFSSIAFSASVYLGKPNASSVKYPSISACYSAYTPSLSDISFAFHDVVTFYGSDFDHFQFDGHFYTGETRIEASVSCYSSVNAGLVWPEPVSCPSAGDVVRLARVENGYINDQGVFINENVTSDGVIEIGGSVSANGCGFARSTDPAFDRDTKTRVYSDNQLMTWENYISTGELLDPEPDQPQTIIKENLSLDEDSGSTDTTQDTSEAVISDPVTVSDSDGSSVTTEQTTTTETKGSGVKVTQTETKTFISETNGIIKNNIQTVTTTVLPDGSSQVVTENRTEYTQTPVTNYTIDNSTNTISVTATGGSSAGQTTATTETFDSNGTRTGSSSSSSGTGDSEVIEDQEAEEDREDMPSAIKYQKTDSWYTTKYPDGLKGIFDSATENIEDNGLVGGFFTGSGFPNSGHIPSFDIPPLNMGFLNFSGGSLSIPDIVVSFLRTFFMVLTLLACRYLVLGG